MEDYHVKQIQPNHADHISYYRQEYLDAMMKEEIVVGQPKYDGERMLIHIDHGNVYCTSRRYSKKTNRFMENQDKLPILQEVFKDFPIDYTVLDCECYAKDWSEVVGVLHSLPERAKELQKTVNVKFAIFDCLFYNGDDLRDKQYYLRLSKALDVVQWANYENLHFVQFINENLKPDRVSYVSAIETKEQYEKAMQNSIDAGFEGVVLKSLQRKYYDKAATLKCKKFETVDCVVIDYQQGTGKYSDTVGALIVGYYVPETGKFVGISHVNCGTDADRDWWRDNWDTAQFSVIEVKCQEITNKSLRHPVYIRRRDDKDCTMCTKETIFKE